MLVHIAEPKFPVGEQETAELAAIPMQLIVKLVTLPDGFNPVQIFIFVIGLPPVILEPTDKVPLTSKPAAGAFVPIPIFPEASIRIRSVSVVQN